MSKHNRRSFFKTSTMATGGLILGRSLPAGESQSQSKGQKDPDPLLEKAAARLEQQYADYPKDRLDLSPARWIWFPSERTLANSVLFFRKSISLPATPVSARGWIIGDSRYKLYVNGVRLQFGPAPCDPRWPEADPVDLTGGLSAGENVIGAEVLYYGLGDGTSPIGKPGFIFLLEIRLPDGSSQQCVSDESWQTAIASSWKPGGYKRWYLRSFQEIFDARMYPTGWNNKGWKPPARGWLPAMVLHVASDMPSLFSDYPDYLFETEGGSGGVLRKRSIPLPDEPILPLDHLGENHGLNWQIQPEDYFDFHIRSAYTKTAGAKINGMANGWVFDAAAGLSQVLTFELPFQAVGFPGFTITCSEGTVVELLVHESHLVGGEPLINSHFNAWTRLICQEGTNEFETFDYESVKFIQLLIRNATGQVRIEKVHLRRRIYPWKGKAPCRVSDPAVQRVLDAAVNTLYNCALETCVDGMGRERQQYSGDGSHQLHAIQLAFGETPLHARFCNTFSQGITLDGYFMDSWPAYDRMARLFERQLDISQWGPLLDHSVGFNFDCYYYYLYSGETASIREVFPRLVRFYKYLISLIRADGLLPVENIGVHWVWMDTDSYPRQSYKQCAFNLYAVAMMRHAFAPLARAFGEEQLAAHAESQSDLLLSKTISRFWNYSLGTFVDNPGEPLPHYSERALSLALIYDLCPENRIENTIQIMTGLPPALGRSYPANVGWNYWAYGKIRRPDLILGDIRKRWASMESVQLNNTLSEAWVVTKDSSSQWSHCALSPLYCMYMNIAGIRPLQPGFSQVEIQPQLGDLEELMLVCPSVKGEIRFHASGKTGYRTLSLTLPEGVSGVLLLDYREKVSLPLLQQTPRLSKYKITGGKPISLTIQFS